MTDTQENKIPLNLLIIRKWVDGCDSVTDAARRLEMQRPNLQRLLSGDRTDVRLSTLEHLADVIGVEPAELIRRATVV